MQLRIENKVIELRPGSPQETAELEVLWRKLVDCVGENKRLIPIGSYIPVKDNVARFIVEDPPAPPRQHVTEEHTATVSENCSVVCTVCNKYLALKAGDEVPLCCGRPMECMD